MSHKVAELTEVSKDFKSGDTTVHALIDANLTVHSHELLLLLGPSGSGKTTLLSLLGSVIYPSSGKVYLNDICTNDLSDDELSNLRLHNIGFVFQGINLIAPLTALQNVQFPLQLMNLPEKESLKKAKDALEMVGMTDRLYFKPKELSGGQQQRVAVARALVTDPPMILCDEPTASLDQKNFDIVMQELKLLAKERNKAIVVVTHDIRLKAYADKIIELENGYIQK